jgi:hypothetical protein
VAAIHRMTGCFTQHWASFDGIPGVALVPLAIEVLGR